MKNILVTLLAVVGLSFATVAQTKLGHVNSQEILVKMPEYKQAQTKAETFAKELEGSLQSMTTEYQKKLAGLQSKEGNMTNTERETAISELQQLEQRIQSFQVSAQERMQKQESELLTPIIEKVRGAIKKVGETNGFTYIFDLSTGATVYQNGTDVTPLVKKELGLQ
ncbi:OmpH family outer membrane protein [Luteibaculum oceani]|uniref:OmpH family outer membrane protein n=1 Tax=Luteibaculum oceani TaxID=1294296 RepID=A0A5C6V2N3_9FLAO|nr:OmpH family outer membrane protein [Luteibaculum oceani]TXC78901.1 OmpH family outer membrane protein [Luteibaculum oceani]